MWDDAPLTIGSGPRTVLLAGPDSPLARAFAERLARRGVGVRRVGDALPDGAPGPEVAVMIAGPTVQPDSADALDTAHHALVAEVQSLLPELARHRPRVLVVTEDVHVTGVGRSARAPRRRS